MPKTPYKVSIYTDGSCYPNPGTGGWGAILLYADGREKRLSGGAANTTNNRMEMQAAISSLAALPTLHEITLYTDSKYVSLGATQWSIKWRRNCWKTLTGEDIKNRDLWEQLCAEVARHSVTFVWVRGHDGNKYNEQADQLANEGRLKMKVKK